MFKLVPLSLKLLTITLLIAGAAAGGYFKGKELAEKKAMLAQADYRAKAEKQISDLKTENIRISDNITVKFIDRVNTINSKETIYKDRLVDLGPGVNEISTGWVELHDAAARLADPDAILASDKSPSGVMDNAALAVVLTNYRVCHENKQQLISLQNWFTETKTAVDASNSKVPKEK
jgi:hypothetical protein